LDALVFIGLLILVFVGLPIGLGLLFYFVPKKFGYPKTAKYLTIVYGILVLVVAFIIVFEDQLFTKNDAKKLVEEQNIKLGDKFDLIKNESSSAIGDYYHTFILKISRRDRQQAITIIKNSKIFKADKRSIDSLLYLRQDRYFGPKIIQDYETEDSYVREYFQPSERQGYAPTFRRLSISKTENKLKFEDIDE
jgi:hypothetical protein